MFFFASLASVAMVCAATKIPVPLTGRAYTVGQLFALINTNNPAGTSKFLILTASGDSQAAELSAYNNQSVVLNQDPVRINQLVKAGVLTSTTKAKYQKIMLYFKLPTAPAPYNTFKYYINDPNPGRRITTAGITRDPAANIIAKWGI